MKEVIRISKQEAMNMISNYRKGRFFTVTFVKRSDGSVRVMNCRKGVQKDLTGNGPNYEPASKGLVCVRDVQIRQHRMISLENIQAISMDKKNYQVIA